MGSIQFVVQYVTLAPSKTGEFHCIQNKDCSLLSLVQVFAGFVFVSIMAYTETNTLSTNCHPTTEDLWLSRLDMAEKGDLSSHY